MSNVYLIFDLVASHNKGINENRNTKLKPLDLLVLLILNQSTTDYLADIAFINLKDKYKTYKFLLESLKNTKRNNLKELEKVIHVCGLSRTKAEYIKNTLEFSVDEELSFLRKLNDKEALKALTDIKGIGIKSASCLLLFAFKRDIFPIDTHVMRVLRRLGVLNEKISTETAHKTMQERVNSWQTSQNNKSFLLHLGLIKHGREICKSKKPLCNKCYLKEQCNYFFVI